MPTPYYIDEKNQVHRMGEAPSGNGGGGSNNSGTGAGSKDSGVHIDTSSRDAAANSAVNLEGQIEANKKIQGHKADYVGKIIEGRQAAIDGINQIQAMAAADKAGDQPYGGPLASEMLGLQQVFKGLFGYDLGSTGSKEFMNKISTSTAAQMARNDIGSRIAQQEFARYLESGVPGLSQSAEGRAMLYDYLLQAFERKKALGEMAVRSKNPDDYFAKEDKYWGDGSEANPGTAKPIILHYKGKSFDMSKARPGEIEKFFNDNGAGGDGSNPPIQ
jgi:hypothetical protein